MCKCGTLTPDDFMLRARNTSVQIPDEPSIRVEDFEKKAISGALSKHNGNLSKASEELGMARSTLYRKIAHFGMETLLVKPA